MGRLIDTDSVMFTNFEIFMCEGDYKQAFKLLCEKLDDAPTVDAEPVRHGHWIRQDNGTWVCSECQSWIPDEQHYYARYCLHCGAKMDLKDHYCDRNKCLQMEYNGKGCAECEVTE